MNPTISPGLPHVSDDAIVISGISGRFPDCANVKEFSDNLFNKVDMITTNTSWEKLHPRIPRRMGIMKGMDEFDPGFFGVPRKHCKIMEPTCRLQLTCTYEAILDAGLNPADFAGTRTAVIEGTSFAEAENILHNGNAPLNTFAPVICLKSTSAKRISYWLKTMGASYVVDSACSSSIYAFAEAYRLFREDSIDYAIVCGSNVCINPNVTLQFAMLGVLSADGICKSFDDTANGYVRSQGISVCILQRVSTAKRMYAEVIHTKTNCDGYKQQGITYPSGHAQKELLREFYEECGVSPAKVAYVEAHGTGTTVGDPEELRTIDDIFCSGKRKRPLYIGSVKSNIGHNEPASAICGMMKVIFGFEHEAMVPNINFSVARKGIEGLEKGRLVVVCEKTPWPKEEEIIASVNSFGFGGANGHTLLRRNEKIKTNEGMPLDDIPRLVCVSGRTEIGLSNIMDDLQGRRVDVDYVALLHNIFRHEIPGCYERGYILLSKNGTLASLRMRNEETKEACIYFGGADEKLSNALDSLMQLPTFSKVFHDFQDALTRNSINYDLKKILNKYELNNTPHLYLGTIIAQLGTYQTLKVLGVHGSVQIGESIGALTSYFARGLLSLEEVAEIAINYTMAFKGSSGTKHDVLKFTDFIREKLRKRPFVDTFLDAILNVNMQQVDVPRDYYVIECGKSIRRLPNQTLKILGADDSILVTFLENLGFLYVAGYDLDLAKIYPKVQFPVSRGTPMINSLINMKCYGEYDMDLFTSNIKLSRFRKYVIKPSETAWKFVKGHVIDGRDLFPATGYLYLVWDSYAALLRTYLLDVKVVFENVKFIRAVHLPKVESVELSVVIFKGFQSFEVMEGNTTVVTGTISRQNLEKQPLTEMSTAFDDMQLNEKDIYKELRLRGYNYSGFFKSLKQCNVHAGKALVEWNDNWVAFLDNMLQMAILQLDTRSLYVPTGIERLSIDVEQHTQYLETLKDSPQLIPVYTESSSIKSAGVEIRCLKATSISKRKPRMTPVLESYKFIANETQLSLRESTRINVQIILENSLTYKVKAIELVDDATKDDKNTLSPLILEALEDQPLVQPEVTIYTQRSITVDKINVENQQLKDDGNGLLVIGSNLLQRSQLLEKALLAIKVNGFVLSREDNAYVPTSIETNLQIFTIHKIEGETLYLLRKVPALKKHTFVNVETNFDRWLPTLQTTMKTLNSLVVLYAQNQPKNGILGLINCMRREANGDNVRCLFLDDTAPNFDENSPLIQQQLSKGMAVNIFRNSQWGTYRHLLLLNESPKVSSQHCYVNVAVAGDLSSLTWMQGPIDAVNANDFKIPTVQIHYAALNFRDVMTASGRISADVITKNREKQLCLIGIEFSGVDVQGRRVMGMVSSGALSTVIEPDFNFLWTVPNEWTLAEAATIPVVYSTSLYAMLLVGRMKRGESILIHSGTGGVGQAAINIALYYGCTIFTTVGTEEKRRFIKENFPQIPDSHIGNSRDCSFERMIFNETSGRGVDLVLNSLADEKLQSSVRCLAAGGRFLEIGKFDIANNSQLYLGMLQEGKSFSGVMLDGLLVKDPYTKRELNTLLMDSIKNGMVKPLKTTVFKQDEIEQAFRFMATGKHMGKVLINIRREGKNVEKMPKCLQRIFCNPDYCTVICGGLGGFGLELADWLVLRGAKKIVLTSRKGVTSGYQQARINIWRSYGVQVVVATDDITKKDGCIELLRNSSALGPIESIFNLAVVLRDKTLENQTVEDFKVSFAPKVDATRYLDAATRNTCPYLKNFVVFSSVSCGRGNGGQTNYGMANSIMERICEERKKDGFPALAIQWGAVGDVGLVAEATDAAQEVVVGGTLQQRITSCLSVLDVLMTQDDPVVSSMVVAEKKSGSGECDVIEAVANILGIRQVNTVSPHATLPEIGMDSMMGVEIKQTLEREYEIFLTPDEIRTLTFAKLQGLMDDSKGNTMPDAEDIQKNTVALFRFIDEESAAKKPVIEMKTSNSDSNAGLVFLLPGIEGMSSAFNTIASGLSTDAICLQYSHENPEDSILQMAINLLPHVHNYLTPGEEFTIVAHSFGTVVALELAALLEAEGYLGRLILIDGSPALLRQLVQEFFSFQTEKEMYVAVLITIATRLFPIEVVLPHKDTLIECEKFEDMIDMLMDELPVDLKYSKAYQKQLVIVFYKRLNCIKSYSPSYERIKSKVCQLKAACATMPNLEDDLATLCKQELDLKFFEGDHMTILENPEISNEINKRLKGVSHSMGKSIFQEQIQIEKYNIS